MTAPRHLALVHLSPRFTFAKLPPHGAFPAGLAGAAYCFLARTDDELSIICPESLAPDSAEREDGWRGFRIAGQLDFALVGIMAHVAELLADAGISLCAVSTFDTDYFFVRENDLEAAVFALESGGYAFSAE